MPIYFNGFVVLIFLDDNFSDYVGYWSEKYYRNGFVDGAEMIIGCLEK